MSTVEEFSTFEDGLAVGGACGSSIAGAIPDEMTVEFTERVLKGLPSNIFLKDRECRYVFATKYWAHIEHEDGDWSIKGKTDFDIRKDQTNAKKAYEEDQKILATGVGCSYIIKELVDDRAEYLEIIKSPVFDDNGNVIGIVGLINNVTEKELMRLELERLAKTDPMTGLFNRHHFSKCINDGLDESQIPGAVIMADCDKLKVVNDTYGHAAGNDFICMTANLLRASLPERALVFRTGGDEFVAIVPKADEEETKGFVAVLRDSQENMRVEDRNVSVSIGYAVVDEARAHLGKFIEQADFCMYDNKGCNR